MRLAGIGVRQTGMPGPHLATSRSSSSRTLSVACRLPACWLFWPRLFRARYAGWRSGSRMSRRPGLPFGDGGKPKPADITLFTRQMATMLRAGVPLVQSFDIVADGFDKPSVATVIRAVRADVSAGASLAAALRAHPRCFDALYCSLVHAGEQAGALETLLDRVATYQEKTQALKARVRKALTYPTAVIIVALVVSGILLIEVVPQFQEIFLGFGADLPPFTLFVIGLSEALQDWWPLTCGVLAALIVGPIAAHRRSPGFRRISDRLALKLPLVGGIVENSAVARYARTLATTFAAGVPLVEALNSVSGATGNTVYQQAVAGLRDSVATGQPLYVSMRAVGVFPNMVVQMVAVGEEAGALDDMLAKSAAYYEAQVDNSVDNLTSLMEPVIMSALGVLIGGLVVAMYLPIFQLGSVIGG